LVKDLPVVGGKARFSKIQCAGNGGAVAITEDEVWAVEIGADVVVAGAVDELRGHYFSACLELLAGKG